MKNIDERKLEEITGGKTTKKGISDCVPPPRGGFEPEKEGDLETIEEIDEFSDLTQQ